LIAIETVYSFIHWNCAQGGLDPFICLYVLLVFIERDKANHICFQELEITPSILWRHACSVVVCHKSNFAEQVHKKYSNIYNTKLVFVTGLSNYAPAQLTTLCLMII